MNRCSRGAPPVGIADRDDELEFAGPTVGGIVPQSDLVRAEDSAGEPEQIARDHRRREAGEEPRFVLDGRARAIALEPVQQDGGTLIDRVLSVGAHLESH